MEVAQKPALRYAQCYRGYDSKFGFESTRYTEMLVDSYVDMYQAGRITGKRKQLDKEKMVYTLR